MLGAIIETVAQTYDMAKAESVAAELQTGEDIEHGGWEFVAVPLPNGRGRVDVYDELGSLVFEGF